MIQYHLNLEVGVKNFKYKIVMSKTIECPFHPNHNDTLVIDDFYCQIERIIVDLDGGCNFIEAKVVDSIIIAKTAKKAVESLVSEIKEMMEYDWSLEDHDLGGLSHEKLTELLKDKHDSNISVLRQSGREADALEHK